MTCPKCKTEDQSDNFCSNCGAKMEQNVAKSVWYKFLNEYLDNQPRFVRTVKIWKIGFPFYIVMFVVMTFFLFREQYPSRVVEYLSIDPNGWANIFLGLGFCIVVLSPILFFTMYIWKIRDVYEQEAKSLFCKKFPAEAEILKKAEGEKNG